MIERLRTLLPWIGYPAFAIVSFLGFLYLTFPLERLKPRLERQASTALGMDVTIGELSPRPLAGISAESVNLVSRPGPEGLARRGAVGDDGKQKPLRVHLDQVVVKVGLLALLWGGLDVSFWAQGLGGEVDGTFAQSTAKHPATGPGGPATRRIVELGGKTELEKINLALLPMVKESIGLPLTGRLSGKVELSLPEGRWNNAAGSLELDLEDCSVGDGKAKLVVPSDPMLRQGVTMPRVRIGRLRGTITIEKGVATVSLSSLDRIGEVDVEAEVEGKVTLRDPVPFSTLDLFARLKLNPELKKRDVKFEFLENGMAKGRRPDGGYGYHIGGLLREPKPRPAPSGGSGSPATLPPGRYRR